MTLFLCGLVIGDVLGFAVCALFAAHSIHREE